MSVGFTVAVTEIGIAPTEDSREAIPSNNPEISRFRETEVSIEDEQPAKNKTQISKRKQDCQRLRSTKLKPMKKLKTLTAITLLMLLVMQMSYTQSQMASNKIPRMQFKIELGKAVYSKEELENKISKFKESMNLYK